MATDRRLRKLKIGPGFESTREYHSIEPGTANAVRLSKAIGKLRLSERLPFGADRLVEFWGAERCWAHAFAHRLWLYYSFDEEHVRLWAVHNYLHNDPDD